MRVFVPHKMVDSHDEFVIKSSVNGGVWKEMPSIFHSGLLKDRQVNRSSIFLIILIVI